MSQVYEELQALVGVESELKKGNDEVNKAMIRHWCEAMEDGNPLYTDEEYAKANKYGGIIAPPQMVQAYCLPPLWPRKEEDQPDPFAKAVKLMRDGGYFGVVATTTSQEYFKPMLPGDQISFKIKLDSVSPEKTTRVGTGHFITAQYTYTNQKDDVVCIQSFTVLTFKPAM